jgi:hypothetical protein
MNTNKILRRIYPLQINTTFWDTTSCNLVNFKWRFGAIYNLHSHCRRLRKAKISMMLAVKLALLVSCLAYSSILKKRATFSFDTCLVFTVPHDVISQEIITIYSSHWENLNFSRSTVYPGIGNPTSQHNCNSSAPDTSSHLCSPMEQEQKRRTGNSFT